jgi:hypothetical protein
MADESGVTGLLGTVLVLGIADRMINGPRPPRKKMTPLFGRK